MITNAYVAEMAAYNRWQNDELFGHCDALSDAERKADRGLFFGSMHHTLDHILMVDRAILSYLENDVPPPSQYSDMIWPIWEALKAARGETDAHLAQCAQTWDVDWMAADADVRSPRLPQATSIPRWVLITQMFNHQTHHRSQVTSELHRMGIDYGRTDMPFRPGGGYFVA